MSIIERNEQPLQPEFEPIFFAEYPKVVAKALPASREYGLFAAEQIEVGQVVMLLPIAVDADHIHIRNHDESFGDCHEYGVAVLPHLILCPDHEHPLHFLNHSHQPNCTLIEWGKPVMCPTHEPHKHQLAVPLVAKGTILANEHITVDYALFTTSYDGYGNQPWQMERCWCNAPNCPGHITGFDGLTDQNKARALHEGSVLAHILLEQPNAEFLQSVETDYFFAQFLPQLQAVAQLQAQLAHALHYIVGPRSSYGPIQESKE